MKTNTIYRQGDVMIRLVKRPSNLSQAPQGSEVLALGEHSGHGHKVEGDFTILTDDAGNRYVDTAKGAKLSHLILATGAKGDHDVIELPALEQGFVYEVVIQNEYNPFMKVLQTVID